MRDQLTKLAFSGLYDSAQAIFCFVVADDQTSLDQATDVLSKWGRKYVVQASSAEDNTYERFTLSRIKPLLEPHDKVLYLHTKGVSHADDKTQNIYWWRNYMEYFLVKQHKRCTDLLDHFDAVGVDLLGDHYSGNFWWTRGDYYLGLQGNQSIHIGEDYFAPEKLLLERHPNTSRVHTLWQSHTNHYLEPYPPNKFVDTSNFKVVI